MRRGPTAAVIRSRAVARFENEWLPTPSESRSPCVGRAPAKQNQQGTADVAHGLFAHRHYFRAPSGVVSWIQLRKTCRNNIELRLRVSDADARPEPGNSREAVFAADSFLYRVPHEPCPQQRRGWFLESCRHHANHGSRRPVQTGYFADDDPPPKSDCHSLCDSTTVSDPSLLAGVKTRPSIGSTRRTEKNVGSTRAAAIGFASAPLLNRNWA